MRCIAGALFALLVFSLAPAAAQSPQYRRPAPALEECPQGRQIRAQKPYPASMTNCQVLDADTAAENRRLGARLHPPPGYGGQPVPAQPGAARRDNSAPPATAAADVPTKQSHRTNYISVEADNGAIIKVDMNSIQRGDGAAIIFTYADEGKPEDAYNLQGYMFDCQGHYELMGLQSSPTLYASPRSVAARISELACSVPVGTVPK